MVLNKEQIDNKIRRIAYQIIEHHYSDDKVFLVGIDGQGYILAERLFKIISKESELNIVLSKIVVDKNDPYNKEASTPLSPEEIEGKTVIVVDDVLNSGKTMIYAIKAFLETKLNSIKSVVLVNRSHHRFPITADFVGLSLATTLQEHIEVSLEEENESVYLR